MSYILEALKKSERDRAVGGVPTLSTEQTVYLRSRTGSPWVLGAVMVLVGLSFGIALSRYGERAASRSSVHRTIRHSSARVRTAPQGVAPLRPATVTRSASVGAAPRKSASPVTVKPIQLAPKDAATASGGAAEPARVASSGASRRHAVPASRRAAASAAVAAVMPVASRPATSATDLPLLQDLPATIRQGLPALHVDVHVYDKDPARRFVLINMQRYREGDTLAAGPRLLRITRDGVVLEYQGVRFRLASE